MRYQSSKVLEDTAENWRMEDGGTMGLDDSISADYSFVSLFAIVCRDDRSFNLS